MGFVQVGNTASLHQGMWSTGYTSPGCSALIGWFSTAVIGAAYSKKANVLFSNRRLF